MRMRARLLGYPLLEVPVANAAVGRSIRAHSVLASLSPADADGVTRRGARQRMQ
jgi:hypothetical protein